MQAFTNMCVENWTNACIPISDTTSVDNAVMFTDNRTKEWLEKKNNFQHSGKEESNRCHEKKTRKERSYFKEI
jgi:hypothetical protein